MAAVRFALVKGTMPVIVPTARACELDGFYLDAGSGGPTGRLDGLALEGGSVAEVVKVPRDLAPLTELALKKLRHDAQAVSRIHVGETWDPFLGPLDIHGVVLEAMQVAVDMGVEVVLHTRANLSRKVIEQLELLGPKVRVELPFVSMRPDISAVWEPGAATPGERLRCARSMTSRGVRVSGRVEPLLPLINDTQSDIDEFCVAFSGVGMARATVAYLRLTPERARAMSRNLSRMHRDILKGCFEGRSWLKDAAGASYKTLPHELRDRGLRRFVETAQRHGLSLSVCGCRDGDVIAGGCHDVCVGATRDASGQRLAAASGNDSQLDFFGEE